MKFFNAFELGKPGENPVLSRNCKEYESRYLPLSAKMGRHGNRKAPSQETCSKHTPEEGLNAKIFFINRIN